MAARACSSAGGGEPPIHYVIEDDDSYVLRSAGPDGEFHTDDDLRSDTAYPEMRVPLDDDEFEFGRAVREDGEGDRVRIGPSGIRIEDGDKRLEINPGRIQGGSKDEGVELDGASIRVRDGEKKLSIELPSIRVTNEAGDD